MRLFDLFRRRPPIRDAASLANFIDENAAFLVQKGIYEYSRARAGPYAKMLMVEPAFVAAVNRARWLAYPLGLAMMAEMIEGMLQPPSGHERHAMVEALATLVLSVFDRYPLPEPLAAQEWAAARDALAQRLAGIGLHPPKPVRDIPTPMLQAYFDLMPIDERLRGRDLASVHSYLRIGMVNAQDRLAHRFDAAAVAAALCRAAPAAGR